MSHTLHREGTVEDLRKDYVVICTMSQLINKEGSAPEYKKFLEIAEKYPYVNISADGANLNGGGNLHKMKTVQAMKDIVFDGCVCHVVFDDLEVLGKFLAEVKEANLSRNIVVSGLLHEVGECCRNIGIKPHTVNMSLGIYGKLDKLYSDDVREISTMCGHGMITSNLVLYLVERLKKGSITLDEASDKMSTLCTCGVYNPTRGKEILRRMAGI